MFNRKLMILGSAVAGAILLAGCGNGSSVPESQIPTDLATYLYSNTPDDGIDQTENLKVLKTQASAETKNEDGTVTIPVVAEITDKSNYTGQFELTYKKTDDNLELIDVSYVDRDSWEI